MLMSTHATARKVGFRLLLALLSLGSLLALSLFIGSHLSRAYADTSTGSWTYTGSMNVGVWGASAVKLGDGRVLVAGGAVNADGTSPAQIYDPSTGSWSQVINVPDAISDGFGVWIPSIGKALIGGYSGKADLYDPVTDQWSSAGSLTTVVTWPRALLVKDGNGQEKVLVVGGRLPTANLYDPVTNTWSATGPFSSLNAATAVELSDGRVLVAGGSFVQNGTTGHLMTAEIYDPTNNSWAAGTNQMSEYRTYPAASLLPNGKVLFVGHSLSSIDTTAELYDPSTDMWTTTGSTQVGHGSLWENTVLLNDGKILLVGGNSQLSAAVTELYDPSTGTWTETGPMNAGRMYPTPSIVLANGEVLVAGGYNNQGIAVSAELYNPPLS